MYARVTTTNVSPYRLEEEISIAREHTLPAAKQQDGFKGYMMLVDRSTGRGITITFWDEEPQRQNTGPNSAYFQESISHLVPLLTGAPFTEDLEIVIRE